MAEHTRTEGKRLAAAHGPAIGAFSGKIGVPFTKGPPQYFQPRLEIFEAAFTKQTRSREKLPKNAIKIKLPDRNEVDGESGVTTPLDIAKKLGK